MPCRIDPYYVQEDDHLDEMAEVLKPALEFVEGDIERVRANFVHGFRKLEVEITEF